MTNFDIASMTLIISDAYRTGWEVVSSQSPNKLEFASSQHKQIMYVSAMMGNMWDIEITFLNPLLSSELEKTQSSVASRDLKFYPANEDETLFLFSRAAALARALPTAGLDQYVRELHNELNKYEEPLTTEAERTIRVRIGQNIFRASLLDFWGGKCAVTRIDLAETLRASHIKPWALCNDDAERLDVFNGLLLVANIDAIFDKGIISFSDKGTMLFSEKISRKQIRILIPSHKLSLSRISEGHKKYLAWHRENVFQRNE